MPIDAEILRRLRESDVSLRALNLSNKGLTDADIQALCEALKSNSTLIDLDLSYNEITDAGVAYLALLQRLIRLNLTHNNEITDAGVAYLAPLQRLSTLYLSLIPITDAGVAHLARLQSLTVLYLDFTQITDGVAGLALLQHLTTLDLSYNQITDAGAACLALLQRLTTLDLSHTPITDAGIGCLALLQSLTTLYLRLTPITDAGVAYLAHLRSLATLDLSGTPITDAGVAYLAPLQSLATLDLSGTQITDTVVASLELLQHLTTLDFSSTQMTAMGCTQINTLLARNRVQVDRLITACQAQDLTLVDALLNQGIHPYGKYIQGKLPYQDTLLHLAARESNKPLLDLLLTHGAACESHSKNREQLTYTQLAKQLKFPPTQHLTLRLGGLRVVHTTSSATAAPVLHQETSSALPLNMRNIGGKFFIRGNTLNLDMAEIDESQHAEVSSLMESYTDNFAAADIIRNSNGRIITLTLTSAEVVSSLEKELSAMLKIGVASSKRLENHHLLSK